MQTATSSQIQLLSLQELLDAIGSGDLALPDFQREYLWSARDVRSLLVTVFRGWPAGSLLLMQGEAAVFALRPLEGAPPLKKEPRFVVLDGQQRLTALYHAFANTGPDVYAVDVERIPSLAAALNHPSTEVGIAWDPEEVEQAVVAIARDEWERKYDSINVQAERLLLPTSVLRSAPDFFNWRDDVAHSRLLPPPDLMSERLTDLYRLMLGGVQSYNFPCVILDRSTEPSAIARIFERLNRSGLRLGAFDLVVARTYDPAWNLRSEFERARTAHPLLDRFLADDGMPILEVLALHEKRDVRQNAVLDLDRELIRGNWHAAADAVESALGFLVDHCGVVSAAWLPYDATLVVLAAIGLERDLSAHRTVLRRWFWTTSFGSAFDVAANTRTVREYTDLLESLTDSHPSVDREVQASSLWLATRRRNSALWRSFLCAIAVNDPHDPTGADLGIAGARRLHKEPSSDVMVGRVFPAMQSTGTEDPLHLRVLNTVLLHRETAARLRGEPLPFLLSTIAPDVADAALASQLLPPTAYLFANEGPEAVLRARFQLLIEFLERETDIVLERDIETEIET